MQAATGKTAAGADATVWMERIIPGSRAAQAAIIAAVGLAIRVWLVLAYPIVFGNDSMVRLVNRDRILMSYQLPLLQLCLFTLSRISTNLFVTRLFVSSIGALAGLAFYLLAADLVDRRAAFWSALLFTANPFIAAISTVPYQETLMIALLLFAFHFLVNDRWWAASLCLGAACLTRFEPWAACPVFLFAYVRARGFRPQTALPRRAVKGALLFGWAPLAWTVFRRGLSPAGSYVLDQSISIERLYRVAYLGWITLTNTAVPALLLACAGLVLIFALGKWRDRRLHILAAFTGLFVIAILFSAHGEPPNPARYVTIREAHIPITAVALLAAFAFLRYRRLATLLALLGVPLGVYGAFRFVARETSKPEIRLGYEVARYFNHNAGPADHVLILSHPLTRASLQLYFDKVRETGGEAAVRDAEKVLATVDTSPLDYQRVLIHSHLGRDRLKPFPEELSPVNWIAVWSDFSPSDARSADWARIAFAHPTALIQWGGQSVAIYHCK